VFALALLGQVLSFLPEPIGPNAQAFSAGARTDTVADARQR